MCCCFIITHLRRGIAGECLRHFRQSGQIAALLNGGQCTGLHHALMVDQCQVNIEQGRPFCYQPNQLNLCGGNCLVLVFTPRREQSRLHGQARRLYLPRCGGLRPVPLPYAEGLKESQSDH